MRELDPEDEEKSIELSLSIFSEIAKTRNFFEGNEATIVIWALTRVLGGIVGNLNLSEELDDAVSVHCETLIRNYIKDFKEYYRGTR